MPYRPLVVGEHLELLDERPFEDAGLLAQIAAAAADEEEPPPGPVDLVVDLDVSDARLHTGSMSR